MPEDMPDRMPDRIPEDMSDRMPEDLPTSGWIFSQPRASDVIFNIPEVNQLWFWFGNMADDILCIW
jgi:hypothetical protein